VKNNSFQLPLGYIVGKYPDLRIRVSSNRNLFLH